VTEEPQPTRSIPGVPQQPPAGGPSQPPGVPLQPPIGVPSQARTAEVLPSAPVPGSWSTTPLSETGSGRRFGWGRALAVGAAGLAAAGVIGGAAFAWGALSGGGDQPEQHLPASSLVLFKVDLDPGASQKISAIRFAHRFAGFADDLDESQDLRRWIYEKVARNDPQAPAWSQVEPWLGQRAGVALLPGAKPGDEPVPVVALQVKDEAAARSVLQQHAEDVGSVVSDGWALLAETGTGARSAAEAAEASPLSEDPVFSADMEDLGEDGIAAAWVNIAAMGQQAGTATARLRGLDLSGHGAVALRFSGKDLEMAGAFRGLEVPTTATGTGVEALPSTALFAVGAGGAGDALKARWDSTMDALRSNGAGAQIDQSLAGLQEQYGLRLPDDLYALLGTRITLMLAGPGAGGEPEVGVRAVSDAPRLTQVLTVLSDLLREQGVPATVQRTGDGWVLGTSAPLAEELTRQGDLGRASGFRAAVPDAAQASFVAYADCAGLAAAYGDRMSPDSAAVLKALDVVGVSARYGEGQARITVRIASR
jgi:hypothetical protein